MGLSLQCGLNWCLSVCMWVCQVQSNKHVINAYHQRHEFDITSLRPSQVCRDLRQSINWSTCSAVISLFHCCDFWSVVTFSSYTSLALSSQSIGLRIVMEGDAVVLLAGQRTCNLQVAGSSPGWRRCVVALDKLLTPVCLWHQAV